MSYQKAPQDPSSPNNDQDRAWISPSSTMNFDDIGDGPHLSSNLSFNLGGSRGMRESETYRRQHEYTEVPSTNPDPDIAPSPNSSPHQDEFNPQDSYHNPLGLSHQTKQSNSRRLPVVVGAESATKRASVSDSRQMGTVSGMASPDETLVGGYSPQTVSRWGRFWRFRDKSDGHRKTSRDNLTMDMQPIDGATCPSGTRQAACEENNHGANSPDSYCDDDPKLCSSRKGIQMPRFSAPTIWVLVISVYSTAMSAIWLALAIRQPRYAHKISSRVGIAPSTASMLSALLSKTIELSFVATFICFVGQALSRRALSQRSQGMTLADVSMRSWAMQPGSSLVHFGCQSRTGLSVLGILSLLAALVAASYTTASEVMVAPKLKFGGWENKRLLGYVRSSYANVGFVQQSCQTMLTATDINGSQASCFDVMVSGESYRNLQAFMGNWTDINTNGSSSAKELKDRPVGTASLNGTIALTGSWIETEHSNMTAHFERTRRIINNVTLAMPHPGVAFAAKLPDNKIMQPEELSGVGEYAVKAGVVSPAVNVLCVNMSPNELKPLIYTEWPNANITPTNYGKQMTGPENWKTEVPPLVDSDGKAIWLNKTVVDDIFLWGAKYERRPPVFRLFPNDYHTVVDEPLESRDAIYVLGKSPKLSNYTMCQLRSWVSPECSTEFHISGTSGSKLTAHCEDPNDANSYRRSSPPVERWPGADRDWMRLGEPWRTASDMNGGERNSRPASSRVLTQLALEYPELSPNLPSMAEALAVFAGSTLVLGSVDTPFVHFWNYSSHILGAPGLLLPFHASVITQEYTSSHIHKWQSLFYGILGLMVFLNFLCLFYLGRNSKFVTDLTEPQNLFALALNSAPNDQLRGSCGGGPEGKDLAVPWRVGYSPGTNHYSIAQATGNKRWEKMKTKAARPSSWDSFAKLNKRRGWL